ncbi:MAG: hypothetical protein ACLRIO_06270 [Butyricicoccus sp.]
MFQCTSLSRISPAGTAFAERNASISVVLLENVAAVQNLTVHHGVRLRVLCRSGNASSRMRGASESGTPIGSMEPVS